MMAREQSSGHGALVNAAALLVFMIGASSSFGAVTVYPSADGTIRDIGVDGSVDAADWSFNDSSFEGTITLATSPEGERILVLEDRLVWEYSLAAVSTESPVAATLNFTIRGAPAFPRPDVEVHVYAYDADLVEQTSDFSAGYSGGGALFQGSVIVPPYQPPTIHTINVTAVVNDALSSGLDKVAFRFQVDPDAPPSLYQAFIDALDAQPETKPFLLIDAALPCDFNNDGEVNLVDFTFFAECMAGPTGGVAEGCGPTDVSPDNAVDLRDLQLFQSHFYGHTR